MVSSVFVNGIMSPTLCCFSRSSDPGCETGVVEESPEKAISGKHQLFFVC